MRNQVIIILVCLAALLLRLIFLAQSPTLAPDAYDTVRQIEHIRETGLPMFSDELNPERIVRALPVFPYIIAFASLLIPLNLAYFLVPNLLAVLLHGAIFYLVLELTNKRHLAIMAAIASIFIPSYLQSTLFTLSSVSLAMPLLLIFITLFIKLRKSKEHRYALLLVLLLLIGTSSLSLLLLPFLILTLTLATLRRASNITIQYEIALFTFLLIIWFHLIYYRDAILAHGFAAIQGNAPSELFLIDYGTPAFLTLALAVGLVPFGLTLYAAYKEGVARHQGILAALSLAIVTIIGMTLKIIPTGAATTVFACTCIVLGAVGLQHLNMYGKTLRNKFLPRIWNVLILIFFVLTSILPSAIASAQSASATVNPSFIASAAWLKDNSLSTSVVLADPKLGDVIASVAKRTPYIDNNYLGEKSSEERQEIALRILAGENLPYLANEQKIDYIIRETNILNTCLNPVYEEEFVIMKVLCK